MSDGTLERLIEALDKNTAVQEKVLKALGSAGGKAAASTTAKDEKPAKTAGSKKKGPTLDDITKQFGGYLGTKDKELRDKRMVEVKSILEKFDAPKATQLDESDYEEALGYLQCYIDGETPDFEGAAPAGGGEDDDDDGALV